jgi:carbon monoxide dehydrogenase subunit G
VKIAGSQLLPGTREQVWELFNDPQRLAKLLPGCERLEPDGKNRYKVAIKFALAAFSGAYSGSVELSEQKPPKSMHMRLEGKGAPGFMKGEGKLELEEKGGQTEVRYAGEAQVGGLIAAVGQRMIEAAAKKILQQFFQSASAQLQNRAE